MAKIEFDAWASYERIKQEPNSEIYICVGFILEEFNKTQKIDIEFAFEILMMNVVKLFCSAPSMKPSDYIKRCCSMMCIDPALMLTLMPSSWEEFDEDMKTLYIKRGACKYADEQWYWEM